MSYLTVLLGKHENIFFFIPDIGEMLCSSLKKLINSYFYQWGFSPRVHVVKQVLLHLFAFKLYLKIYLCGFFFRRCVGLYHGYQLPTP